jgi:SAM-dependent methyltransferase
MLASRKAAVARGDRFPKGTRVSESICTSGGDEHDQYLPGMTLRDYLHYMERHPRFRAVLDLAVGHRIEPPTSANEFDTDVTGRGDSYRLAQRRADVRSTGIVGLLELALDRPVPADPPADLRVLDVLGGDGTIARAAVGGLRGGSDNHWVLTGDLSRHMIAEAVRYGLPAVCQSAQQLVLRNDVFDAVILAYGTHHIPPAERKTAYAEAWRVLKPGGRLVVHDFEDGGPVARWFAEVVHRYAPGGHAYEHFTLAELRHDLTAVGFTDVSLGELFDPFVVPGATPEAARELLCSYIFSMYGLFGLRQSEDWADRVWKLACRYMRYPEAGAAVPVRRVEIQPAGSRFVATMPRIALTAVGVKPS